MRKHLLAVLLALPCLAQAQTSLPFTIKGKLGTLGAPAKIYLVRGMQIADSAMLKNGAFELKGTIDEPTEARLIFRRKGRLRTVYGPMDDALVFLERGVLAISSPDSLAHATFKGGPSMTDYLRLTAALRPTMDKSAVIITEIQKATEEQRKEPLFKELIQAKFDALNEERRQINAAFIKANPGSWVSLYALTNLGGLPRYDTVGPLYEALSPVLKSSARGREYGSMVQALKELAIGQPAPIFSQRTPDGKTVSLADYRGKYVLVDFWASWCKPCRAENPALTKVYDEYKSRNFDILGVSLDGDNGKWVKAIQDDHLAWTQISDLKGPENAAARRYAVNAIPQNYLVGPDGKIVAVNLHGAELGATLAKLIK